MAGKIEDDHANLMNRLSLSSNGTDMGEVDNINQSDATSKADGTKINSFQKTFKRFLGSLTAPPGEKKMSKKERNEIITSVTVGALPQRFLVKYVGSMSCEGLWGSKVTRVPVDLMVRDLKNLDADDDLPLINVKVQEDGFKVGLQNSNLFVSKV